MASSTYVKDSIISGSDSVGGLCGQNYRGTIGNSYAVSETMGTCIIGGLCGDNYHGTIRTSYTIGKVVGDSIVGGFCGYNSGAIYDSFWDTQTSGQSIGIGYGVSTGVIGKITLFMQKFIEAIS